MTNQEHQYIENVPSFGEFAKEKRGGYATAQVDGALQQLQAFSADTANKYNQVLKSYSDLVESKTEADKRISDLENKLNEAPSAEAVEQRIAGINQAHAEELEAAHAQVLAEREQLQAAFADAVKAEAARMAPSVEAEKSKVADIVEAITDEATAFVKKSIDRVAALEEDARVEAEATKQAARDEADRVLTGARDEADRLLVAAHDEADRLVTGAREEATTIVVAAREEANRALDARNHAVTETKEIWERLNMFATAQSQQAQTQVSGLATSELYQLEAPLAADSTPAVEASSSDEEKTY